MFHVEHIYLALLVILMAISGCKKPIEHPEALDPIYLDIQSQESAKKSQLEGEQKKLQEAELEMRQVKPQTGQSKVLTSRYFEAKNAVSRTEQELEYLKLALRSRKKAAIRDYLNHYNKNEDWHPENQAQEYQSYKKLRFTRVNWTKRAQDERGPASTPTPPTEGGGH